MQQCSVVLVEEGFPPSMPGFLPEAVSATFPFWGQHQVFDFAAANFRGLGRGWTILAESRFRPFSPRFPAELIGAEDSLVFTDPAEGLNHLRAILRSCDAPKVVLAPLSQVCLLDTAALQEAAQARSEVVKLTVGGCPTDIFLADRRALTRLLGGPPVPGSKPRDGSLAQTLFETLLAQAFETIADVPGMVFSGNSMMQLYTGNLWLVRNYGSPEASAALCRLRPVGPGPQTVVEQGGEVRDSVLGPGCRVAGYVEGSILFPGVVVHKGAVVYNSVVMTGNRIGARTQVCRALLLPDSVDRAAAALSIGENVSIGLKASTAANATYPEQIRDGVTVIGMGVEIPRGFCVGPGCLVGPGVTAQRLKGIRELRKGSSLQCTSQQ